MPTLLTSHDTIADRSSGWRSIIWRIATATCASPCSLTGRTPPPRRGRRRRTAQSRCRRIAGLNRRYGPAPGGDRFSSPSSAALERGQGSGSDGNASAESCMSSIDCCGAPRIRPCPGRRPCPAVPPAPLRHRPRCRHAIAAGRRQTPGREDGSSAEPAELDPNSLPCHRRLRGASAAGHAVIAHRWKDHCSSACFRVRAAWIPTPARFGRVPGPVR